MHFTEVVIKFWRVLWFVVFFLGFSGAHARQYDNDGQNAPPSNNGILFSLEKNGRKSYILGTIHSGFSSQQALGSNILDVLSKVDDIYLEADISDDKKSNDAIEKYGSDHDGPGLRHLIGDEKFETYFRFAVIQYQIFTPGQFQRIRPWLLAMLLPVANRKGDQAGLLKWGTEAQLVEYAHINKLPILEIEGFEHQFLVYNSMDEQQQRDYLDTYVSGILQHVAYDNFRRDVEAWTNASYADLEKNWSGRKLRTDFYSRFHVEKVVEERSAYFSRRIAAATNIPKTHLFAVGEQHLVGEHSLVNNLRKQGFKLKLCMPIQECLEGVIKKVNR